MAVNKIRNNTQVCLYYLLGAFRLLDKSVEKKEQLGIIDYSLELLYYNLQTRIRFYKAVFADKTEAILYFLHEAPNVEFDESGNLKSGEFKFLVVEKNGKICVERNSEQSILEDEECVRKNTIIISRKNLPPELKPIRGAGKWMDLLVYK